LLSYQDLVRQHIILSVHVDDTNDVNLLGDNTNAMNKTADTLIDSSKEVGLKVNVEKTQHVLLSRHQNAGHSACVGVSSPECRTLGMCCLVTKMQDTQHVLVSRHQNAGHSACVVSSPECRTLSMCWCLVTKMQDTQHVLSRHQNAGHSACVVSSPECRILSMCCLVTRMRVYIRT
jgi:hypothetical protein